MLDLHICYIMLSIIYQSKYIGSSSSSSSSSSIIIMRGSRKFSRGGGGVGPNSRKGSDEKFQHGKN